MHACIGAVQVNKLDWLVWMTSAISTVCLGVQVGLAISIGLALLLVIYESAFPRISVLGCLPQTTIYRCALHTVIFSRLLARTLLILPSLMVPSFMAGVDDALIS